MKRGLRIGDWLAVDDESGLTHYASEMARDWDGQFRHVDNLDGRHPQYDVKARNDPAPLPEIRVRATATAACLFTPPFIGDSAIPTPANPRNNFAGIGDMTVEGDCGPFVVYP